MSFRDLEFNITEKVKSSVDDMWKRSENVDLITTFWHGIRDLKKNPDGTFSIRFAFPANGIMKIEKDAENHILREIYLSGPFKGTKELKLTNSDGTECVVTWKIKLSTLLAFRKESLKKHFGEGTVSAIKRMDDYTESPLS
ncbi:hypothetical protein OXIME_000462 [Oxyplasma meridianum]|uniref:SRPBCC family protein n=1 Tax=Oxyplasma meridianum TaxID=3073602 RepID=A0AAX4NGM1_9ARCH